jgi:hypothetical protein
VRESGHIAPNQYYDNTDGNEPLETIEDNSPPEPSPAHKYWNDSELQFDLDDLDPKADADAVRQNQETRNRAQLVAEWRTLDKGKGRADEVQQPDDNNRPVSILKVRQLKDKLRLPKQVEDALGPSPGLRAEGSQSRPNVSWDLPPRPSTEEEPALPREDDEAVQLLPHPRLDSDRTRR